MGYVQYSSDDIDPWGWFQVRRGKARISYAILLLVFAEVRSTPPPTRLSAALG
jgi:hypothetical protein